ncbi:MAG: hypothetical protein HYY49_03515 [Ignavibacteriales bacterium]|nr:hypothetical protein [Ignavibacteriales bacterium]
MKQDPSYIVIVLLTAIFVGFQCESGVRGRVVEVKDNQVIVFFLYSDSVRVGEEFSLWRDRKLASGTQTYRTGIVEITKLVSPDTAEANITYGEAEVGDKVTKWMISDEKGF